jgi:hypothetical protein
MEKVKYKQINTFLNNEKTAIQKHKPNDFFDLLQYFILILYSCV